jgi:hypothetical protein
MHIRLFPRAAAALIAAILAGCIQSEKPLLTGAQPAFGDRVRFQLYSLKDGAAHDPEIASYRWDGSRYVRTGGLRDIESFSLHTFEGRDSILQTVGKKGGPIEYGIARWLAEGTYLVFAIDETNLEWDLKSRFCRPSTTASCRIDSPEGLFALARAAAAQPHDSGGLALRLAAPSR